MYVLDSSSLIELFENKSRSQRVADIVQNEILATTTICMHEVLAGALSDKERFFLDDIFSQMQILVHDESAARYGARIEQELERAGARINAADIFIAGICKAHGAELITLDNDFSRIKGLRVHLVK